MEANPESAPGADRQPSANAQEAEKQNIDPLAPSPDHLGAPEDNQYLTGLKLAVVLLSLTLVFFLVMMDIAIVTTVSLVLFYRVPDSQWLLMYDAGCTSYHQRLSFFT